MDLFSLAAGIALGSAFAPFWMMVWSKIKSWVSTPAAKE